MAVFEHFPYTNFHELNLDYVLKQVKEMQEKIDEFTELLATGPVVDVKTNINGASTSIKNGSGIANLPAASDTTAGVINLDLISDDVVRISGAETVEVPVLTGGMIDESQLPPTVEPATSAEFGTVKVASTSTAVNVTSGDGTFSAAKLDSNGDIDASVIPDSGVTAGTYGTTPLNTTDKSYYVIWGAQVDADGRITEIHQNPVPLMRSEYTTIAAGSYTQSIYFNTTNFPWYNTGCFLNVNVYELTTTGKGAPMLKALVPGTDYNYTINNNTSSIDVTVTLTAALSNPAYVIINGSYGRASM